MHNFSLRAAEGWVQSKFLMDRMDGIAALYYCRGAVTGFEVPWLFTNRTETDAIALAPPLLTVNGIVRINWLPY